MAEANTLKALIAGARREAALMEHHYLGVEHLLAALIDSDQRPLSIALQKQGYSRGYVLDTIRRHCWRGTPHRQWLGHPHTPRTDVIINIAHDLALEDGRKNDIREHDILKAIIEEGDSLPLHLFRKLRIDLDTLLSDLEQPSYQRRHVLAITPPSPFTDAELDVLNTLFPNSATLEIRWLQEAGFEPAFYILAQTDQQEIFLIKIGSSELILDQRQQQHHNRKLQSAIQAGGDKAAFAMSVDASKLTQLEMMSSTDSKTINAWLRDVLLPEMHANFWKHRTYTRMQAWEIYDWLLPPILTISIYAHEEYATLQPEDKPISRVGFEGYDIGDEITLERFTVHTINSSDNTALVAIDDLSNLHSAYPVQVTQFDIENAAHYRGERIPIIMGQVTDTRTSLLIQTLNDLQPDFKATNHKVPINIEQTIDLVNPVHIHKKILHQYIEGYQGEIHGNLGLGTFLDPLYRPNQHVLLDFATLELSIVERVISPLVGSSWDDARYVLQFYVRLHNRERLEPGKPEVIAAFEPIQTLRQSIESYLGIPGQWEEYMIPLAVAALHDSLQEYKTISHRRLAYLIAALACDSMLFGGSQ